MSIAGDRIKACRIACRLTQEDVAKHLGIGKQAVYKYEAGTVTNIPLENIEQMASLFGVLPEYLSGWSSDKEPTSALEKDLLSLDEIHLVNAYRGADDRAREDALRTLVEHQKQVGSRESTATDHTA